MQQAVDGVEHQEHRRPGDERRLPEPGERLGLAMTESVLVVGR